MILSEHLIEKVKNFLEHSSDSPDELFTNKNETEAILKRKVLYSL